MDAPRVARDLMVTRLVTVTPETDVFEGIRLLHKHKITGAPVVDGRGDYLGVLSEKCILSVLTLTARLAAEAGERGVLDGRAADIMTTRLVTLSPDTDAFEAIGRLLRHRISGAPVVAEDRSFLGVFSERYAMSLLIQSAYEQVPLAPVGRFMNTDMGRTISEATPVVGIAQMFLDTYYRRLPVLRDGTLVGQISRRDVVGSRQSLLALRQRFEAALLEQSEKVKRSDSRETRELKLPSAEVANFMDTKARTIGEETDLLSIAQIFLQSNARRLPVVEKGKLRGQISRRDVLQAAHEQMAASPRPERALLYLSAVQEPSEVPPIA